MEQDQKKISKKSQNKESTMVLYRTKDPEASGYNNILLVRYCDYCGTEAIGFWESNAYLFSHIVEKYKYTDEKFFDDFPDFFKNVQAKEIVTFFKMDTCPCCGKSYVDIPGYHCAFFDRKSSYEVMKCLLALHEIEMANMRGGYPSGRLNPSMIRYITDEIVLHKSKNSDTEFPPKEEVKGLYAGMPYVSLKKNRLLDDWWEANLYNSFDIRLSASSPVLDIFRFPRRNDVKKSAQEKHDKFLKSHTPKSVKRVKLSEKVTLKEYLKLITTIESDIFETSQRLRELYEAEIPAIRAMRRSAGSIILSARESLEKLKRQHATLLTEDQTTNIKLSDFSFQKPTQPTAPQAPEKPVYEKPGLFNRRRILTQNELRLQQYNEAMDCYNRDLLAYNEQMVQYENALAELRKDQQDRYQQAVEQAKSTHARKVAKSKAKIESAEADFSKAEASASNALTPEKTNHTLILKEISAAEQLLTQLFVVRAQLYSCDIVFEKYRDLVSVATFYEYLSSGRCETLEGDRGAYNLYEQEIRSDRIINQLSKVITSLEDIKSNQYSIYTAIKQCNTNLKEINASMKLAVDEISQIKITANSMDAHLKTIEENSSVTAYYSQVTAFYSKKTAELTDALGYMVALS